MRPVMRFWEDQGEDILVAALGAALVFLFIAFSARGKGQEQQASLSVEALPIPLLVPDMGAGEGFVASRNGTRYYPPGCGGRDRIKEENRIVFLSEQEALQAGYTLAQACNR